MFKKLIAIILLVGAAAAEVTFHYEGYCFGKEIPRNYYSLITWERKAVILKEKAYAVVRVTNKTQSDINIRDMKFDISEEEEKIENKPFAGYRYYCETTGHHCVKPTESYRIFVPIPESKLHGRGKIEAYVYRPINEEDEKVDICTENPLSQKCELVLSEPCYEGLESSLSFFSGVEYTLKLCAVGTAPTYFMYDIWFDISIAIVGANQGKNNRKVGRFGHFEFPCEHVKREKGQLFGGEPGILVEDLHTIDLRPLANLQTIHGNAVIVVVQHTGVDVGIHLDQFVLQTLQIGDDLLDTSEVLLHHGGCFCNGLLRGLPVGAEFRLRHIFAGQLLTDFLIVGVYDVSRLDNQSLDGVEAGLHLLLSIRTGGAPCFHHHIGACCSLHGFHCKIELLHQLEQIALHLLELPGIRRGCYIRKSNFHAHEISLPCSMVLVME